MCSTSQNSRFRALHVNFDEGYPSFLRYAVIKSAHLDYQLSDSTTVLDFRAGKKA